MFLDSKSSVLPVGRPRNDLAASAGFEPATSGFVFSRSNSVELRSQMNWDLGFLFQSAIRIHKSEIKVAGAFRFELKISVLETDVLPIETTRLWENLE